MAPPDLVALRRAEANLRGVAAFGREAARAGPFAAFLAPPGAHPYLSVAVPGEGGNEPDVEGWRRGAAELVSLFAARERSPRIEAMEELHPALRGALERAGWRVDPPTPVLALPPGALPPGPAAAPGLEPRPLAPADLPAFLRAQGRAFGPDVGDGDAWLGHLRSAVAAGTNAALGLYPSGDPDAPPVAGATLQIDERGDAELAGVFTVPERRRRGLAGVVCRELIARHLASASVGASGGGFVWLSAAPGALGVYRRLGFVPVGHQLGAAPRRQG